MQPNGLNALTFEEIASIQAMLNNPGICYAQRVRFYFYSCKERLAGPGHAELCRRLDRVLNVALQLQEEWHSHCLQLLADAVSSQALAHCDGEFFSAQITVCVPGPGDRPPARTFRRVGQPRAY